MGRRVIRPWRDHDALRTRDRRPPRSARALLRTAAVAPGRRCPRGRGAALHGAPGDFLGGRERFLVLARAKRQRAERHDASEHVVIVDHRQPPDLGPRHGVHRLIETPVRMRDHWITSGALAHRSRRQIGADGEGAYDEIAVGDHAAHLTFFDDRKNADVCLAHELGGLGQRRRRVDRDDVADHHIPDLHGAFSFQGTSRGSCVANRRYRTAIRRATRVPLSTGASSCAASPLVPRLHEEATGMNASLAAGLGFKRALVPLDGSIVAEAILPRFLELAHPLGIDVALIRVVVPTVEPAAIEETSVALGDTPPTMDDAARRAPRGRDARRLKVLPGNSYTRSKILHGGTFYTARLHAPVSAPRVTSATSGRSRRREHVDPGSAARPRE